MMTEGELIIKFLLPTIGTMAGVVVYFYKLQHIAYEQTKSELARQNEETRKELIKCEEKHDATNAQVAQLREELGEMRGRRGVVEQMLGELCRGGIGCKGHQSHPKGAAIIHHEVEPKGKVVNLLLSCGHEIRAPWNDQVRSSIESQDRVKCPKCA